jgi:selenophosphate synthetase-related protein
MMLEYSGKGGTLDLDGIQISKPSEIPLEDWLRMYISLGFLVANAKEHMTQIERIAENHALTACVIGVVDESRAVKLSMGGEERTIFDFAKGPVLTPKNDHE